jgi:hypothetical protein
MTFQLICPSSDCALMALIRSAGRTGASLPARLASTAMV